jgi:glycosyltransferase involved in cell wall biosynthesis
LKVSIITATYNSSTTVGHTLSSVNEQDFPNIEHIIVDGQSKDETLNIVSGFPHVTTTISEKDDGIYDAMNKGISMAKGEIIGILNSDDFYAERDVVSQVVKVFMETGCDAVYGDLVYVDKDNVDKVIRYWKAGPYKADAFMWGWMPPHPTLFVSREVYEKYGLFNLDLNTAADYELMLRFIHKNKIRLSYIPRLLVRMRAGGASNNTIVSRLRANRADRAAWTINGLKPYWFTLYLKPIRKLSQFYRR